MIHYHGGPITPETAAAAVYVGGHAFPSFEAPVQIELVAEACQSFAVDNGAYAAWRAQRPVTDWSGFYEWFERLSRYPNCDFAVIPDTIDGTEQDNDALIAEWPFPRTLGAPVWHMHESLGKLARLVMEWPRVCLGSSGEFATVGSSAWWGRMAQAMTVACDFEGRPYSRLHGLRMLNSKVFTRLPLASADSTNIARNIGIDKYWTGSYPPKHKAGRAALLRHRIEAANGALRWEGLAA